VDASVRSIAPQPLLQKLQRNAGNRTMQVLSEGGVLQRKLTIGAPDDIYEREADRMAESVIRLPPGETGQNRVLKKERQASGADLAANQPAAQAPNVVQHSGGRHDLIMRQATYEFTCHDPADLTDAELIGEILAIKTGRKKSILLGWRDAGDSAVPEAIGKGGEFPVADLSDRDRQHHGRQA